MCIIDRILALCMSYFIMNRDVSNNKLTIFCLIALLIAAIECLELEGRGYIVFFTAYFCTCFFWPEMILMLPIIACDLARRNNITQYALSLIIFLLSIMSYEITTAVYLGIMSVTTYVLGFNTYKNERLSERIKRIRDDSIEQNMFLTLKNKELMDSQDREIYYTKLKERNRIARDIHDNVGHMLTRSILQMGALMTIHKEEPLNSELDSVKKTLDTAMNNVRESVHDLHDESIDLKQSVEEIVKELESDYTIHFVYDIDENPPREYKYAIIGVVKEATANIIKHSVNDMVDIILREHPAMYQLTVHDYMSKNGEKKNKQKIKKGSAGIGMSNMEDRVAKFNGSITVTKENGYKLFATFMKQNGGKK